MYQPGEPRLYYFAYVLVYILARARTYGALGRPGGCM
jgi:hypothetical protein